MSALFGPLLNNYLTLFATLCIRYYPLKSRLRLSVKWLCVIYIPLLAVQCAGYILFQSVFGADYTGYQWLNLLTGVTTVFIPFFLTKNSFYENLFLLAVAFNYVTVVFGVGHYIELTFGGAFAERFPYIVSNTVSLLLSLPLLPLLLFVMQRLFMLMPDNRALMWKFVWIIPAIFFALCMMTANIFMGAEAVSTIFVTARVAIGVGMVATCFLFARALRQEADNAALAANARMMENQLILQREQYERLTANAETEKAARHDLRHQLAVIGQLADADNAALKAYVEKLTGSLPVSEKKYCENFAVNAVMNHHLSATEAAGIRLDIALEIPENAGRIADMDLCVLVGNLLENAVEACRHVKQNERFIRAHSQIQGDYITVAIENSFDNSRIPRGGIGLSSVKTVCEKYNGRFITETNNHIWRASAVAVIN